MSTCWQGGDLGYDHRWVWRASWLFWRPARYVCTRCGTTSKKVTNR